jgi:hypothetical protein
MGSIVPHDLDKPENMPRTNALAYLGCIHRLAVTQRAGLSLNGLFRKTNKKVFELTFFAAHILAPCIQPNDSRHNDS